MYVNIFGKNCPIINRLKYTIAETKQNQKTRSYLERQECIYYNKSKL